MIRVNSDPHTGGFVYVPKGAVTAFFPAGQSSKPALQALINAGFAGDRIEVLSGPQGAELQDADGRGHGLWARFMRSLEETFADEYALIFRAAEVMRSGGDVVALFDLPDEEKRRRAAEVLIASGGQDVTYWGQWTRESFSVGSVPVLQALPTTLFLDKTS